MSILVTGGAGFIGRWVSEKLLSQGLTVKVLDDLSNGSLRNINDLASEKFCFRQGSILDNTALATVFNETDLCIHLAAQINVQDSLDTPQKAFATNIAGTYNVLEQCRKHDVKLVLIGTCMVYDLAQARPISEEHPIKPASPYAGSKIAAENLALSYYYGYGLPIVTLRPFNTYGPYQKSSSEGGVVSIFLSRQLAGQDIMVYGDGTQTRDLLYVEDCADFIVRASFSKYAVGEVINAGTGKDISVNDLALLVCGDPQKIRHVPHIHQQSEIRQLVCDYSKAKKLLGWEPKTSLAEGLKTTAAWLQTNNSQRAN
jgi:nucleoside-diphosphate-sugar epimerase